MGNVLRRLSFASRQAADGKNGLAAERKDADLLDAYSATVSGTTLSISGSVTKPVNGQPMASAVNISELFDLLSAPGKPCPVAGMRPCLVNIGTASVKPDGTWSTSIPNVTIPAGMAIRVQSNITSPNLGGQSTISVP